MLIAAALWGRTEPQLLVLRRTAASLGERYLYLQEEMLRRLEVKLKELVTKSEKLLTMSSFQKYVADCPSQVEIGGAEWKESFPCSQGTWALTLLTRQHRKFKYALYLKSPLQKSVQDFEDWYRRWDPSWFLIARLALPEIDAAIREHRSETDDATPLKIMGGLRDAHRANMETNHRPLGFLPNNVAFYLPRQVDLSTASVCARSDSHTLAILDHIEYRPGTSEVDISDDVQSLARVMSNLDPVACNLLKCEGVKRNTDEAGRLRGFSLAFEMPPPRPSLSNELISSRTNDDRSTMVSGHTVVAIWYYLLTSAQMEIRSLRSSLLRQTPVVSISFRLAIAKSMARAVIFLHSASFVHKNIRPETVLTTDSGSSYLVGFQKFRATASHTYMLGDALWHENVYRHPTRQGVAPEDMYTMLHDVYSLGVCLLEIGLWSSFVQYAIGSNGETSILPGLLEIAAVPKMRDERRRAFELKRVLTDLATSKLPGCMGDKYTSLVVSCLSCLDKTSKFIDSDAASDNLDDGTDLGARYIQGILSEIEDISM
jgi:serine/threonine protein kinase